jgi:hypothetical protein
MSWLLPAGIAAFVVAKAAHDAIFGEQPAAQEGAEQPPAGPASLTSRAEARAAARLEDILSWDDLRPALADAFMKSARISVARGELLPPLRPLTPELDAMYRRSRLQDVLRSPEGRAWLSGCGDERKAALAVAADAFYIEVFGWAMEEARAEKAQRAR